MRIERVRALALVALAATVPLLPAGCFDCRNWIAGAEWTEPQIYNSFPEPGPVNGFIVEHHTLRAGGAEKSASSTDGADVGMDGLVVRLAVNETGAVVFTVKFSEPISDEAAARTLNATRKALGFEAAPAAAFAFRHLGGTC